MIEILDISNCLKRRLSTSVPQDWEQVVLQARKKNPFHVYRMKKEDFVSLKPLKTAIVNRKINTVGGKVKWLKMHWISVSKDKPLQFGTGTPITHWSAGRRSISNEKLKGAP